MEKNDNINETPSNFFSIDLKTPSIMGYVAYFLFLGLIITIVVLYFIYRDSSYLEFLKDYQSYILIGIMLLFMYWVMYFLFYISPETFANNKSFLSKSLFYLGIAVVVVVISIFLQNVVNKYILKNPVVHPYIFNQFSELLFYGVLGMLLLSFIYKNFQLGKPTRNPGSITGLLFNLIFYIPCIIVDVVEYIRKELALAPPSSYIILFLCLALLIGRIFYKHFYESTIYANGKKLLEEPVYLNEYNQLTTMQDLNYDGSSFQLEYALVFDFSIYSFPPNINSRNNQNISIFNFGYRPNVLYNLSKNQLVITMLDNNNVTKTLATINDIKLQSNYNMIINYKDGTLDIFLNDNLISSTPNVIPKTGFGSITCGSQNGVPGHINTIYYFPNALGVREIEKINAFRIRNKMRVV